MQKNDYFAEIRSNIRLSVPIVTAQLGYILMAVTDNVMVGRFLGATALGTAGVANSIAFLIASLAVGGLPVVAPLISKAKAEGRPDEINRVFRATMRATTGYTVVLTAIGMAAAYFFEVFQQPAVTNEQAPLFLTLIVLSNIPQYYFVAAKQLTDGLSFTSVAMSVTIAGLLFNAFFNYALINGFGPIPALGLNGAAISTLLTRCVMLLGMLWYLFRVQRFKRYFIRKFSALPITGLVTEIYRLSIPSGLQLFFEIGAFSFAIIMMGWLGEVEMAAHQVAINIVSTTYMMALGIAIAGGIRVGEGRGLRNPSRILMSGNVTFLLVALFMFGSIATILTLDARLVEVYLKEPEVIDLAVKLLYIAALFQLSDGLQAAGAGVLRGLSDVAIPTWITFIAYWIIALPTAYWLGFGRGMGAEGVWIGLLIGLTFSAVFLISRFYYLLNRRAALYR